MRGVRTRHLSVSVIALVSVIVSFSLPQPAGAASLKGSRESVMRQNRVAKQHSYTFLESSRQVRSYADQGLLVRVRPTRHVELATVSYPYARPVVKTFIERLGRQYYDATGEKLVVTSLTRPTNRQPHNASELSVHPCGMAVDLRIPRSRTARRWLENTLLSLEEQGIVEATKERRPPHYHVAVIPEAYELHLADATPSQTPRRHKVAEGDTLWSLAKKYQTSVKEILVANRLPSNEIFPGQVLSIP